MFSLFEATATQIKEEVKVKPSLGESFVELRQHLGNNVFLMKNRREIKDAPAKSQKRRPGTDFYRF